MELNKHCPHCSQYKPVTAFGKHAGRRDGLQNYCKDCRQQLEEEKYGVKSRITKRACYLRHKDKYDAANKAWQEANPEKRKETLAAYYYFHKPEINAKASRYMSERYAENPQLFRDKQKAVVARQKGDKDAKPIPNELWMAKVAKFKWRCAYCDTDLVENNRKSNGLVQEHMTPPNRGGKHVLENIIPACRRCNSKKRSFTHDEFLAYLAETAKHTA